MAALLRSSIGATGSDDSDESKEKTTISGEHFLSGAQTPPQVRKRQRAPMLKNAGIGAT